MISGIDPRVNPPFAEKSRNLVRFCRHLPQEQLHESFAADFGFRAALSRFSVMKNYGTLPGPDDCFAHIQQDARPLFEKLLGLEIDYPGGCHPLQPYSSMNYYRSHIEEFFHHTAPQQLPAPPVQGQCVMYYPAPDVLRVEFELRNKSAADVALRLHWFSRPSPGLRHELKLHSNGFQYACEQKVLSPYWVRAEVSGAAFQSSPEGLITNWEEVVLPALDIRTWRFEVHFNDAPAVAETISLADAISAVEAHYAELPALALEWERFESLALRSAGICLSSRCLERDRNGNPVPTLHGGKSGVVATWFWDTATSLLGVGLMKDTDTGWGAIRLLCDGISQDGEPFVRYCDGEYVRGVQNPILAWGVWNFHCLCPNHGKLKTAYEALGRYVMWWRRNCRTSSGLYTFPAGMGCTGLDDALQWQDQFPIALNPGEEWHGKEWGNSRPDQFESVDINCQIYIEFLALARMAEALDLIDEKATWESHASSLGQRIHERLFNPEARVYMARHAGDGRFNGIVSLESFLPVYAGITPGPLATTLCREYLLNSRRFYTTLPFPTLDAGHEAFRSSGALYQPSAHPGALVQQAYWTGRTWLNYSYWMLGALHEAGLHEEADTAAERILEAVSRSETIYECYDPFTGTGTGHAEFPWGAASTLAILNKLYANGPLAKELAKAPVSQVTAHHEKSHPCNLAHT